jgi:ribosome-associated toxin RatA of RatAB toxin-antitoxin module
MQQTTIERLDDMRHVEIIADVPGTPAARAYEVLRDFEHYADLTDAVRSVTVTSGSDGELTSIWEVNFRSGVLRWTEVDRLDDSTLTMAFEQVDGDFDHFSGVWKVDDDGGCVVRFKADFDLGMPSLGHIIDPIAENALRENISIILRGLLGEAVSVRSDDSESRAAVSVVPVV